MSAPESIKVRLSIGIISTAALTVITWLLLTLPDAADRSIHQPSLPLVNAVFNACAALSLVTGLLLIRQGKITQHRAAMLAAFAFSSAFFVGYLIHHARVGSVRFPGHGWLKTVYLSILIPHILLAAALLPLALTTLYRGFSDNRAQHRKIARWTLPVWLFVSVSGVVVYVMLYHL